MSRIMSWLRQAHLKMEIDTIEKKLAFPDVYKKIPGYEKELNFMLQEKRQELARLQNG